MRSGIGWLVCALVGAILSTPASGTAQVLRTDVYVTDGDVNATAVVGNTLYIGGQFTYVGPATGGGILTNNADGSLVAGFPKVVGTVFASVPDGAGGWYIGGTFTSVGGVPRTNLARITSANTVSSWNPAPDGPVYGLLLNGSTIYVGGAFINIGGAARNRIAEINVSTGAATSWNPSATGTGIPNVTTFALSGTTLYVGGFFTAIGGAARVDLAALSTTTGVATTWNPSPNSTVTALAVSGSTVYVGGNFSTIGGQTRPFIAAINATTALASTWQPNPNSTVNDLVVSGSTIYACGSFTTIGGQSRNCVAALDATSALASSWSPDFATGSANAMQLVGSTMYVAGSFSAIADTRRNAAAVDVGTAAATGWNPKPDGPCNALSVSGSTAFVGGPFRSAGGVVRSSLAALDLTTGIPTSWTPTFVSDRITALAASSTTVYVGGAFTTYGGVARNHLASLDAATGTLNAWDPALGSGGGGGMQVVNALVLNGSNVYVGGRFGAAGGQLRNNLAQIDGSTALATSWNPNVNGDVQALALDGSTLYVGGNFTQIQSQPRVRLGAVGAASGTVTTWNPGISGPGADFVRTVAVDGATVYVGGEFDQIGATNRSFLGAISASTGLATAWNPNPDAAVTSIAVGASKVFVGGDFTSIGVANRNRLAAIDPVTGLPTSWDPNPDAFVLHVGVAGQDLVVGGSFSTISQGVQAHFAAFRIISAPIVDTEPDISLLEEVSSAANSGGAVSYPPTARWLLYPGACADIGSATWSAKTTIGSDSLNTYSLGTSDSYAIEGSIGPTAWTLVSGNAVATSDYCSPQKAAAFDQFFGLTAPALASVTSGADAVIRSCAIPVPSSTASLYADWNAYDDLPRGSGRVRFAQYRYLKGGVWSGWKSVPSSGGSRVGTPRQWAQDGGELAEAAQADSVQLKFATKCLGELSFDPANCAAVAVGVLFDDFGLRRLAGVPAPQIGIFPGSLAQSTFVDGTMTGTNCSATPCWPGVRGTGIGPVEVGAIYDNFNSPLGDSITVRLSSALRRNGLGINWKNGFSKATDGGRTIAVINGSYNALYDVPRMIYRVFDPSTKSWSPFDSTELDADDVQVSVSDTLVTRGAYRVNWPPRDKSASSLPGGFTVNGIGAYSGLKFLPRGTRLQYYFKAVDVAGGQTYRFSPANSIAETEDLPFLPGGAARAPDLCDFRVLPGVYPSGSAGTLLFGRTNTPILNLDGAYGAWATGTDPVRVALRGIGVRADHYRFLQGLGEGNNVGGHELPGQRVERASNYFPNKNEYSIRDSLATWYRIVIQSSAMRGWTTFEEQDAALIREWWNGDTSPNGGDRCILATGDNLFDGLLNVSLAQPQHTEQVSLAQTVFGVQSAVEAWTNAATTFYPTVDDRFAGGGPGYAAPNTFVYPVDGGCPGVQRFDGLTRISSGDAADAIVYPGGVAEVAGVGHATEREAVTDLDRNKALAYGYSIESVRQTGVAPGTPPYPTSGLENRMRILYKFLTSCRGPRSGAPTDTAKCWPCPSPSAALMTSNWAIQSGFQTSDYGPLYLIQDPNIITAVEGPRPGAAPRFANALSQNRPNPFNPETEIAYSLSARGRVTIRIYDVGGRLVRTLLDAVQDSGPHAVRWRGQTDDGGLVASGIYFYQIKYPDGAKSAKRMTLLK